MQRESNFLVHVKNFHIHVIPIFPYMITYTVEGGKGEGGGEGGGRPPARSPSELIINAPRLMPLCANDHQAAGCHHVALVLSCEPLVLILHGLT